MRYLRLLFGSVAALALLVAAAGPACAEGGPALAGADEARAALERFEEAWKAKGLTGDERLAVREQAMRELAKVQHPAVAERLIKVSKDRDPDLRILSVMYLGEQVAAPGYAGKAVVGAIQKGSDDPVFLMFCGDALGSLDYRGQVEVLRTLLASKNESVQKHALVIIGEMKETRLLADVLQLMVDLKIDKGMKWEGGEVHVDTGAAGDADQRAAEAAYAAKYGSGQKGKAGGRKMRDLKPTLLQTMKMLTGVEFASTDQAKKWLEENRAQVDARNAQLAAQAKEQDRVAKEHDAAAKAVR
jgi:hypothetical protein